MIFLRNYFINTTDKLDVKTIIHEVNGAIREAKATEGLATIVVPAPAGALAVIEPLPDIVKGLKEAIETIMGEGGETKNRRKEEIDVGHRVAAAMIGRTISIPIKDGKLLLGTREEPVLIDMEKKGLRREFYVQVTGGGGGEEAKQAGQIPQQMR